MKGREMVRSKKGNLQKGRNKKEIRKEGWRERERGEFEDLKEKRQKKVWRKEGNLERKDERIYGKTGEWKLGEEE